MLNFHRITTPKILNSKSHPLQNVLEICFMFVNAVRKQLAVMNGKENLTKTLVLNSSKNRKF